MDTNNPGTEIVPTQNVVEFEPSKQTENLMQFAAVEKIINPTGNLLESLEEQYGGLIITDHKDKNQIKVVAEAARVVRAHRVNVRKIVTSTKQAIAKFTKELGEKGEDLASKLDALYGRLKEVETKALRMGADELEAIESERIEKVLQKANRLIDAGFLSNGIQYIAGTIIVDSGALEAMEEAELAELIQRGQYEIQRIAEILRQSEAVVANPVFSQKEFNADYQEKFAETVQKVSANIQQQIDDLPFGDSASETFQEQAPVVVDLSGITPDFRTGFDACKRSVIELLTRTEPMKRTDLIQLIIDKIQPE